MRNVVIVSAVRTAIGAFGGSLKDISAPNLGAIVIKEALKKINLSPELVDEVLMGNVIQAGLGQNVARQAAMMAGLPEHIPSMTINKVCGSGLRTVSLGAQMIKSGDCDIVIAGGMENMSQAPYLLESSRFGQRLGHGEMKDSLIHDALTDAFNQYHMGITAENIAEQWNISRDEQDLFALNSQYKAEKASNIGRFDDEIVPVWIQQRKGEPIAFSVDEYIRKNVTIDNLTKLKPAFKKEGTVTAGNASGINDGAAAVILMSEEKAVELGINPLCKILSYSAKGVNPSIMGYGPVESTKRALERANLTIEDIDLIEANEAFASQSISVIQDLNIDLKKVNVNGGAIALGHPVGASGTRILVTLIHEMIKRNSKRGLATLCVGGGMGTSLIIERIS